MRTIFGLVKIVAYIEKTQGKEEWGVYSHKGKSLGKYPSKKAAVKRLRQVEWFKNHPKKK